jgi:hypothetical protein
VVEVLATWPGAVWLQQSATAYLFVNATHILGIGLLLGGILPLDLRILGLLRSYPLEVLQPFLTRVAGTGLAIAVLTGAWLFSVKPAEYLANAAFGCKVVLLALALVNVGVGHAAFARARSGASTLAMRVSAAVSAALWLAVLVAGRWIGFL